MAKWDSRWVILSPGSFIGDDRSYPTEWLCNVHTITLLVSNFCSVCQSLYVKYKLFFYICMQMNTYNNLALTEYFGKIKMQHWFYVITKHINYENISSLSVKIPVRCEFLAQKVVNCTQLLYVFSAETGNASSNCDTIQSFSENCSSCTCKNLEQGHSTWTGRLVVKYDSHILRFYW